jgi:hypothetical protein
MTLSAHFLLRVTLCCSPWTRAAGIGAVIMPAPALHPGGGRADHPANHPGGTQRHGGLADGTCGQGWQSYTKLHNVTLFGKVGGIPRETAGDRSLRVGRHLRRVGIVTECYKMLYKLAFFVAEARQPGIWDKRCRTRRWHTMAHAQRMIASHDLS